MKGKTPRVLSRGVFRFTARLNAPGRFDRCPVCPTTAIATAIVKIGRAVVSAPNELAARDFVARDCLEPVRCAAGNAQLGLAAVAAAVAGDCMAFRRARNGSPSAAAAL